MNKDYFEFAGVRFSSLEEIAEFLVNTNYDLSYDNVVFHYHNDYTSEFLVKEFGKREYYFRLISYEY